MKVYQLQILVKVKRRRPNTTAREGETVFLSQKVFPSKKRARGHLKEFKANIPHKLADHGLSRRTHTITLGAASIVELDLQGMLTASW